MKKKEEEDAKKNPPWWKKYADKYQGSTEFDMGETTPPPSDAEEDEFPKVFNMTNGFQKGGVPTAASAAPTGEIFADWPKTEPKRAKTEPKESANVDDNKSNTDFPKVFSMTDNTFKPTGATAKSKPKPKSMEEDTWEHWKKEPVVEQEPKTEVVIEEPPKAPEEPVKEEVSSEPESEPTLVDEPMPVPEPVPTTEEPTPTSPKDIQMSEDAIEVIEEVEVQAPVPEPTSKPEDQVEFTDESAPKPQQPQMNDTVPQATPTATTKEPKPKRKSLLNLTEKVTGKSKLKKMKTKKKSSSTVDQENSLNDQVEVTDEKENITIADDQGSGTPAPGKVVQSSRKRPLEDHEVEGQHSNYSHIIVPYFSNQYQIFVVVVSVLVAVIILLILFSALWIAAL